jgi:hypothetical protein
VRDLRHRARQAMSDDERPHVYVHTDYNPDDVRTFYEIPEALVEQVRSIDPAMPFTQALSAIIGLSTLA